MVVTTDPTYILGASDRDQVIKDYGEIPTARRTADGGDTEVANGRHSLTTVLSMSPAVVQTAGMECEAIGNDPGGVNGRVPNGAGLPSGLKSLPVPEKTQIKCPPQKPEGARSMSTTIGDGQHRECKAPSTVAPNDTAVMCSESVVTSAPTSSRPTVQSILEEPLHRGGNGLNQVSVDSGTLRASDSDRSFSSDRNSGTPSESTACEVSAVREASDSFRETTVHPSEPTVEGTRGSSSGASRVTCAEGEVGVVCVEPAAASWTRSVDSEDARRGRCKTTPPGGRRVDQVEELVCLRCRARSSTPEACHLPAVAEEEPLVVRRSHSPEPCRLPAVSEEEQCPPPATRRGSGADPRRALSRLLPFFSASITSNEDDSEERGLPVPHPTVHGPSAYIPPDELPALGTFNEQTHMLFIDAFLQNNRLDHVTQVMGYHPTYLDIFLRTQNFILRGDGPLPYDYRHFIAIMAAGRHQCSYLINLQKQEFLLQGGEPTWLKGLQKIPQKLRDLYEINKILAHRPWLLNKRHIEKLTKGKDSWSLAEVVHAIVLLAHFHSLSSFVFGCGVNEELDQEGGHQTVPDDGPTLGSSPRAQSAPVSAKEDPWMVPVPAASPVDQEVGVDTLMQRMKSLSERAEEFSQEEKTKRFEHVENQSAELSPAAEPLTQLKADIGQFVDDPTYLYQDFARRGEMSIPTFRVQDYSWDDHGYSLVNRLYNDVGNLLDEKFKTAYNLTYYTMGGRHDVDTSRFRRAIWNYIQCMFGIRHDDYDYGEVNQLLERNLKAFIKLACCFPERVTKKDYDKVLREFKHSEKVHVNLMVLEARMQAELLYALRAVMQYMT